jgi:hypothetical protein
VLLADEVAGVRSVPESTFDGSDLVYVDDVLAMELQAR